jgi:cardiolipin synthase (CMP-forming)
MTTANKITIFRILLVPFFVVQMLYYLDTGNEIHRLLGLLSFMVAAVSDGIDGYIARRYKQRSELGAVLDPLADKLLLVSGVVLLTSHDGTYLGAIPLWVAATIISRDVILMLGLGVIYYFSGKARVRPRLTGKCATFFQMGMVIWILLHWSQTWLPVWLYGAALFTAASGLLYIWDGVRQLNASPASAASPEL